MDEALNSDKVELSLSVNNFDEPTELTGINAWVKLVTNLMFMQKGTYPTDPNAGCEIQQYEFEFIDDVIDTVRDSITEQVRTYLPDIPFESVTVRSDNSSGKPILLIILEFRTEDSYNTAVVAAEKKNNLINFEVVV